MKRLATLLLGLALVSGAFAYWGMFTDSGARHFDEMAGMIPFFVGIASGLLVMAAAVVAWLGARSRHDLAGHNDRLSPRHIVEEDA